jgi:glucose-1-phosphate thymidylyltransferase
LVITTPADAQGFSDLLGNGRQWGIRLEYAVQPTPGGLAQAFIIGRDFIENDRCALVLGDNLIHGAALGRLLKRSAVRCDGATIFASAVPDPQRYGVVEFSNEGHVVKIEEKPRAPLSNWAVIGLYFYDEQVCDLAAGLAPSPRGELEITDLNNAYVKLGKLRAERLGRGYAWFDTGTHKSLLEAAQFVQIVEVRTGQKIGCVEEVAYREGLIDAHRLCALATRCPNTEYREYLQRITSDIDSESPGNESSIVRDGFASR